MIKNKESDVHCSIQKKWIKALLGDISNIEAGNPAPQGEDFFRNGKFPFVRVQDLGKLKGQIYISSTFDNINEKAIFNMKLIPKGAVLFTKSGMSILLNQRAILSRDMYVVSHIGYSVPLGNIPSEWIYYWLTIIDFKDLTHATTLPSLQLSKVKDIFIPLPPLPEQHRIIEKIEELFTKLDAGVAALGKVRAQLKRYRQAVLKAAFSGQLTAEWRQKHSNVGAGSSRPNESPILDAHGGATTAPLQNGNLSDLPPAWMWNYLGNYADVYGWKRLPKDHFYSESKTEFKYIRVTDFENLTINQSNIRYLKPETEKLIVKYKISKNDIYISIAGSIGKIGTIPDNLDKANLTENAAKITNLKNINRKYLSYFLNSNFGQEQIRKLTISSNQPKLALFRIKKIIIPLTIPDEQNQIVSEIERRFSVADEVEKTVKNTLMQAKRLRQSILKMAFEGKLVPQDSNDEPAEKLLERIKAEKELTKKRKV